LSSSYLASTFSIASCAERRKLGSALQHNQHNRDKRVGKCSLRVGRVWARV
jgi:hypothetical protein